MNPEYPIIRSAFGYDWKTDGERWGMVHPNKKWSWTDKECVIITDDQKVQLIIKKHIKDDFPGLPIGLITSNWGVGMIVSELNFSYGYFEIIATLPKGRGLWPAFWLYTAKKHHLQEIDVFEGYSKETNYKRISCLGKLRPYNVPGCIHTDPKLKSFGPLSPSLEFLNNNPSESVNSYGLLWTEDFIKFYVNGNCYRTVSHKKVVESFHDHTMMVIINTNFTGEYRDIFDESCFDNEYPFIIHNFKYLSVTNFYNQL